MKGDTQLVVSMTELRVRVGTMKGDPQHHWLPIGHDLPTFTQAAFEKVDAESGVRIFIDYVKDDPTEWVRMSD